MLVTFLAIIGAADVSPVLMDTVVLLPKHFGCRLDALDPVFGTLGLRDTINDDVCSRKQVSLLPLFTGASLPPKTAHIAKLSSASTSVKSQPIQEHMSGSLTLCDYNRLPIAQYSDSCSTAASSLGLRGRQRRGGQCRGGIHRCDSKTCKPYML
jgi:hypothetical protein